MAILLYANGLTEELKPAEFTFTDQEIYGIFEGYDKIRSFRLPEVPNTWCVWGERIPINKAADEFNQVGSDIVDQKCYSPVIFLHDTEINPAWRLTDDMILAGYIEFRNELNEFFNEVAKGILEEREQMRMQSGQPPNLMVLEQMGISEDKRIIFRFDMDKQIEEFFSEPNLGEFARKVHNFLKFSYKDGDIFAIYADKNIIIVMADPQVKDFIEKIIAYFQHHENYEACSVIRNTYEQWIKFKGSKVKKEPKKKSSKKSEGPENTK
jgi:hypothetical protein